MATSHLAVFADAHKKIKALGERIKGRSYSASELTKLVRRQFPATDFIFVTYRDYAVDPDMVVVAGLYDSNSDSEFLPSITVTMCYHPEQQAYFIDLLDWQQLSFDLAECIGHELVHRDQYKHKRKPSLKEYRSTHTDPKINSEQEYLGGEDEIEAYAFSIAAEMHTFSKPAHECVMYGVYQETFDTDTRIVLKLDTQIEQYKKLLEQLNEQK